MGEHPAGLSEKRERVASEVVRGFWPSRYAGKAPNPKQRLSKAKVTKKAKVAEERVNTQPQNKVPLNIVFPERVPGTLRFAAWNVCGLAASQKKGFKYYVEAEDPDILFLSETKVNNEPMDLALKARFPHWYWSISDKKTYSGTAILSKHKPLSVTTTLPGHPDPTLTLDQKKEWNEHFETYIRDLDKRKPVIWMGDLNVAPTELDLANPKPNCFQKHLGSSESAPDANKFVDVWRSLHPTDRQYTYFSYRFNCREKGIGWRLDMFVLSERIADRVKMCEIRSEIWGASDHCPLVMEIEGAL
ncbi:Endonuclease/exonuclease/phosphatase [Mycena galopus ATCC 62051]|nr:Endonuclease/exonuclease/phosphatase [Mycena galopus ATCC 62051]